MRRLLSSGEQPIFAPPSTSAALSGTELDQRVGERIDALLAWRAGRHNRIVARLLILVGLAVVASLCVLAFSPLPELAFPPTVLAVLGVMVLSHLNTRHRLRRSTARWVDQIGRVLAPVSRRHRVAQNELAMLLPGLGATAALPGLVRLTESLDRSLNHDERELGKEAGAAVVRLLPQLTAPSPVINDPRVRGFLRSKIRYGLQIQPGNAGDTFDLSLHRSPRAGSVYDWEFVITALLLLGEAGDSSIRPLAELLARRHPYERIRAAAEACLRTLNRKEA